MDLLAIGPHPDDIEFGCFGTLYKYYRENDANIHLIIVTSGELGGESLTREEESLKSSVMMDADVIFMREPDGSVVHDSRSVTRMREFIRKINPDIVFVPYPDDTHQDHIATSRVLLSSSKLVKSTMFYETPSTINFPPNVFYDISGYMDKKLEALQKHNSQHGKPYFDLQEVRGLAEYRAWQCNSGDSYFEAFQLFREIR